MIFEKDNLRVDIIYLSYVFSQVLVFQYLFTEVSIRSRSLSFGKDFHFYIDEISMHNNNHTVLLQLYLHEVLPRRMSV